VIVDGQVAVDDRHDLLDTSSASPPSVVAKAESAA
jgi:hypothetical protein